MLLIKIMMFFLMVFTPSVYAEETWKIASLKWGPYAEPDIVNQGSSIQKLRKLLAKENITLIVEFFPWNRAKKLVESNHDYIGIFPAWPEDVFDGAIISPAIDWSEIAIVKVSDQVINVESIDDLFKKHSVGIVRTYKYPKVIDDAIKKYPHHVETASNELSLLKKLLVGRGEVAITDPNVMQYLAQKEGAINIEIVSSIMKKELVLAFRDDEENRTRLKKLVSLLKNNGVK
jgi:polar amino acid transport system substrate-binding protein